MALLKEEKGYTLIIVLLLIVLFMGMSAVFMQASLSHSKQEQTVDYSNQAVAAAEMGVENYSLETEKAFAETYQMVTAEAAAKKQALEKEIKKYPDLTALNGSCPVNKEKLQEWIDCNVNAYNAGLKASFKTKMQNRLSAVSRSEVAIDEGLTYSLTDMKLKPASVPGSSLVVELKITGEKTTPATGVSTASKSKQLSTELTFPEVPFFDEEKLSDVEVVWPEEIKEVTNFFPQLLNKPLTACPSVIKANMPPCSYNGVITENYLESLKEAGMSNSFYMKINQFPKNFNNKDAHGIPLLADAGTINDEPNINSTDNLTIYYRGKLDLKNANKHANNNFFVAEIIEFHNNQDFYDNTFINIGNSQKSTYSAPKITINNGSKLCINTEGVTPNPSGLFDSIGLNGQGNGLSVAGNGQIIFYTKNKGSRVNTDNVKWFTKPDEFLKECGISTAYKIDGKNKFNLPVVTSDLEWEVDMEVEY